MKKRKSVAKLVNSPLRYVREYAPSLTVARASLLPFEELIAGESAGPQHGEVDTQPYFEIVIDTKSFGEDTRVVAKVTAESVTMIVLDVGFDEEGREIEMEIGSWPYTLPALWEYLRQLPRHPRAFLRR